MNKLSKAIIPLALALAFASSMALAEDGSDFALSSVPSAEAPRLISQSQSQDSGSIQDSQSEHCCE